jgi:HEAT repeat protein
MVTFGIPKVDKLARRGDVRGLLEALEYQNPSVNGDKRYGSVGASVRAQAVEALADLGSAEADVGIVRALADDDEGVRAAARAALGKRGHEPLYEAAATWTAEEQADARRAAVEALAASGAKDAAVKVAEKMMSRPAGSVPADREALRRLVETTGGGTSLASHLLSGLGEGESDARTITMLVWLAPESVEPLTRALRDARKRRQAAVALGYIRDARAADALRSLMTEPPDPDTALAVGWALGRIGDPQTGKALLASTEAEDAGEDESAEARPAPTPESLHSLDMDGLAELYDIALDAWREARRAGNTDEEERWQVTATAIVDEALVRPEGERDEAPSRQGGFLNRRRDRQRAQLRAACAERAGAS